MSKITMTMIRKHLWKKEPVPISRNTKAAAIATILGVAGVKNSALSPLARMTEQAAIVEYVERNFGKFIKFIDEDVDKKD